MLLSITVVMMLAAPAEESKPADPPNKKELFATEDWYKSQSGKEQTFEGMLEYKPRPADVVGFGRFNPFALRLGKPESTLKKREVYVGGKDELLQPYAGRKVRLTGKAVDMEVEGQMHFEIWPARIEWLDVKPAQDPPAAGKGTPVKILGQGNWRASSKPGSAAQQLVVRSVADFAKALSPGEDAIAILDNLKKQLQADVIDWQKHMLLVVSAGAQRTGGYRVEVLGISVQGETMTVRWKLHAPKPTDFVTMAFTHPGQAVLVERFGGKVVFDPSAPRAKERPAPRRNDADLNEPNSGD